MFMMAVSNTINQKDLYIYHLDTVVRRCCTWGCGTPGSVSQYEGRPTFFCSSNLCNGIGSENALTGATGMFEKVL